MSNLYDIQPELDLYGRDMNYEQADKIQYILQQLQNQEMIPAVKEISDKASTNFKNLNAVVKGKYNILKSNESQSVNGGMIDPVYRKNTGNVSGRISPYLDPLYNKKKKSFKFN